MFCPNCNDKVRVHDNFCSHCGISLQESTLPSEVTLAHKEKPREYVCSVYPRYSLLYDLIPGFQMTFILALLGVVAYIVYEQKPYDTKYIYGAILVFLIVFMIKSMVTKFHNSKIAYHVYQDHLEYVDDYMGNQHHEITYENIIDLAIYQSFIGKILGFGTIAVYTNQQVSQGVILRSVHNVQEIYDDLKNLVDTSNQK